MKWQARECPIKMETSIRRGANIRFRHGCKMMRGQNIIVEEVEL